MRESLAFFVLSFLIIYSKYQETLSYSVTTQFIRNTSLEGYTCPVNFNVFVFEKCMSDIHCSRLCHSYTTCLGVFYQPETLSCVGCSAENDADFLSTQSLSMYYARSDTRTCSKYSCYLLVHVEQNWDAAKDNCALLGGVLVDILSQGEQDFINNLPLPNANSMIWIGGTDRENEGAFVWLEASSVQYENWYPKEPSNGSDENCIAMYSMSNNGGWKDKECDKHYSSICEFN